MEKNKILEKHLTGHYIIAHGIPKEEVEAFKKFFFTYSGVLGMEENAFEEFKSTFQKYAQARQEKKAEFEDLFEFGPRTRPRTSRKHNPQIKPQEVRGSKIPLLARRAWKPQLAYGHAY